MKTKELTYTEAVITLRDGQCSYIESVKGARLYLSSTFGKITQKNGNGTKLTPNEYLSPWSLGNPTFTWIITFSHESPREIKGQTIISALEKNNFKKTGIIGINLKVKERYIPSGF